MSASDFRNSTAPPAINNDHSLNSRQSPGSARTLQNWMRVNTSIKIEVTLPLFVISSYHYDLGEPVIPDICDEPKTYWLLVEDQHVSFGKGDVYSYASTIHKRAKYTDYPNPLNNFDVTVNRGYFGHGGYFGRILLKCSQMHKNIFNGIFCYNEL